MQIKNKIVIFLKLYFINYISEFKKQEEEYSCCKNHYN